MNVSVQHKHRFISLTLAGLFLLFGQSAFAQNSYTLSSQPDSVSQQYFNKGETLYMSVITGTLNVNEMKEMKWKIEKSDTDTQFSGSFTNSFNGRFTAQFDLGSLPFNGEWKWEAQLQDISDNKVEFKTSFYYSDSSLGSGDDDNDEDKDYVEIKGFISFINSASFIVNKYTFKIDTNTTIVKKDYPISFDSLKLNDLVEVKAVKTSDSTYLAIKIELEDWNDEGHYSEFEIRGKIEDLSDSTIMVNSFTFKVDAQTKITGHEDLPLSYSDLQIGQVVEVEGYLLMDGSYLATKIHLEDESDDSQEIEVRGVIESVGADYVVVQNYRYYITAITKIKLGENLYGTIADLLPGQFVEIEARKQSDGSLLAYKIKVKEVFENEFEFSGFVDSVGVDFLILSGRLVYLDSSTLYYGNDRSLLTLADIRKGQRVEVKGSLQIDGSVLARKIKMERLWSEFFETTGTIENLGSDWLIVNGFTFKIDSATIVMGHQHTLIQFSDLQMGQWVEIKARPLTDGSFLALRVKVEDRNEGQIELTGQIDSLTAGSITVAGFIFTVDSTTIVLDLQKNSMPFSDLQSGQLVEIKGMLQANGSFIAVRISLEDCPSLTEFAGTVIGITGQSLIVSGPEVIVDGNTVLLDANYQSLTLSNFGLGDQVTVWTNSDPANGASQTLQIQQNVSGSVTGISDALIANELPGNFILNHNYPNPFNPSTRIPFAISGDQFYQVRLDVFNVLGQRIKILFNGVLNGGQYRYEWNGANDAGQSVPSGVYFYRLQVGQRVQMRQMLLIK